MSSRQDHRVDVDNGKYTFVIPAGGYRVAILRYGEPWHEQAEAGNALHAMMCELDAARLVLAQVRALAQDWRAGTQARLERVIQQHDALTSDRSPPSPWTGGCDPPGACATDGRCWIHSEWDDVIGSAPQETVRALDQERASHHATRVELDRERNAHQVTMLELDALLTQQHENTRAAATPAGRPAGDIDDFIPGKVEEVAE